MRPFEPDVERPATAAHAPPRQKRRVYLAPGPGLPAQYLPTVAANAWQGETDCVLGPFSARDIAEAFASRAVDFGHFEAFRLRVLAHRDAWYVEVRARVG